jgi:ketosteroid isomerase-like protein
VHPNAELITRFYEAFGQRDGETMAACYHPDASFSDPVFPSLDGEGAGDMWRMLTEGADDLRIEFSDVRADDDAGSAHWEAWYTFSATGRHVHNVIDARFEFRDGLIARHDDRFDFWRWSRQALGLPGVLLGWTPILRNKVRSTAGNRLVKWRARR